MATRKNTTPEKTIRKKTTAEPAIVVENAHKSFGRQVVHEGVNLSVPRGKKTVIVGPSGAGKSVLLKYILGLDQPDSGRVLIEGRQMNGADDQSLEAIRSQLGVVFQGAALFDSRTIFDNVALPLIEKTELSSEEIEHKVMSQLKALQIDEAAAKFPSQISGGMQKRAAMARALVRDPQIILFDEPTTGLDPETQANIYDMLEATHERIGYTALIVSHDIPQIFRIADRIAILHNRTLIDGVEPGKVQNAPSPWLKGILAEMKKWK